MPDPRQAAGRLSNTREAWEQLISDAHKAGQLEGEFYARASLTLLLDIREMLIVNNLIANQTTGLLAQAAGVGVEKRAGGVIIP